MRFTIMEYGTALLSTLLNVQQNQANNFLRISQAAVACRAFCGMLQVTATQLCHRAATVAVDISVT